jgi:hypothetical protein
MSAFTINGIAADPKDLVRLEGDGPQTEVAVNAAGYCLVQCVAPLDKAQKQELQRLGVQVLEYVAGNTYICHYSPSDLSPIRSLPFVSWVHPYLQELKLGPQLLAYTNHLHLRAPGNFTIRPVSKCSDTPLTVNIIFQKGVDAQSFRQKIADLIHCDPSTVSIGYGKAQVTVRAALLPELARIDAVRHVEEVLPRQLLNDVARNILRFGRIVTEPVIVPAPASDPGLEGEGQVVAVADSGFDKGNITDVHPAFQDRVIKIYPLGRPDSGDDPLGHGTHVAGSVLGNYKSDELGQTVAGMAPKARLIVQSLLDDHLQLSGFKTDLHDLFRPPYEDGARIHTNSWGSEPGDCRYDSQAHDVDDFIWNHRDLVVCFAAGNLAQDFGTGRIFESSLVPPGTAKNCITVGATENHRPDFNRTYVQIFSNFRASPIVSDKMANNIEGMAAFSGRGPTMDKRIKPDVVAPGTFILSALSRAAPFPNAWALSPDKMLIYDGGTSMSTPLVAGAAAILREFLIKRKDIPSPSAALVKALLINGAVAIDGQYTPTEAGPGPNFAAGFGRVNTGTITDPTMEPARLILQDEGKTLDSGDEEETLLTIPEGISQLKVTLVWTDPAGEKLQNDLDLIVRHANGEERHGNMDPASTDFDRINNVEQVLWEDVRPGSVSVIVRAFHITSLLQSYALVIRIQ